MVTLLKLDVSTVMNVSRMNLQFVKRTLLNKFLLLIT